MITHVTENKQTQKPLIRAILLSSVLLLLGLGSVLYLLYRHPSQEKQLTAHIYQDGQLIETVDLSAVKESYTLTVTASDGGCNTIAVHPGAIGMADADCPDRLCVSMGFTDSSLLPIVCLPHGLVIEVVETESLAPDAISY